MGTQTPSTSTASQLWHSSTTTSLVSVSHTHVVQLRMAVTRPYTATAQCVRLRHCPLCCGLLRAAVQENHHCALTFAVLSKRGSNLFCRFTSQDEFFAARKLLIDAILGTDMHHHFTLTQELLSHNTVFQAEEDADRTLLVRVHVCTMFVSVAVPWLARRLAGVVVSVSAPKNE